MVSSDQADKDPEFVQMWGAKVLVSDACDDLIKVPQNTVFCKENKWFWSKN